MCVFDIFDMSLRIFKVREEKDLLPSLSRNIRMICIIFHNLCRKLRLAFEEKYSHMGELIMIKREMRVR